MFKLGYCIAAALLGAAVGATAPAAWRGSGDMPAIASGEVAGLERRDEAWFGVGARASGVRR